ncbi:Uncharacterised protein [Burkholderia pseudomallei]|uniref:hypothetical protein n=1 Tax=Burkholderia pseudomallei TaxID=28450 RepID=UPI0009755700|nr:hypothetical protein [Burkholderia pseudomallei]OMT50698.1 hypothetical protein AQ759_03310 [Burkholderia pseudomallei]ONE09633.1 hypothetical protein AQ944_24700 [Burkholderia pseudomallei]CAJ3524233.1 Uncharacterised protein [Burkholderia pseudomallei]CAJ3701479.1 Uncharacterised protein [Burkholderia pseudomallei]CAJ4209633.1 Uncharacterised protein [Burkholderia pseudomallei]
MSVSKSWAYVTEFGRERITAWAIMQERAKYDGKPLGRTYWSNHKPGRRKAVKHVQKAGTAFFAYINPADADGGGEGESLSHRLLKEAIAGLAGTKLKLGNYGEHDITVTHGETEKLIPTKEGTYYADAYLRFTCSTRLALRWSGEVYVEVHNTHAVPVDKEKELRRSRVPVVEVPLLKAFEYPHKDDDTSDPREEAHVQRIRNMLEKGYLAGQVISDRRSVEFLEQEVSRLGAALREARNGWDAEKQVTADATNQLVLARARIAEHEKSIAGEVQSVKQWADRCSDLQRGFNEETAKAGGLAVDLTDAKATIVALRKQARRYSIAGGTGILLGLCSMPGYWQLFNSPSVPLDSPVQPAAVSPVAQPTVGHAPSVPAKRAARTVTSRRHHSPAPALVIDNGEADAAAR